jgi:hypothetical protein
LPTPSRGGWPRLASSGHRPCPTGQGHYPQGDEHAQRADTASSSGPCGLCPSANCCQAGNSGASVALRPHPALSTARPRLGRQAALDLPSLHTHPRLTTKELYDPQSPPITLASIINSSIPIEHGQIS